MWVVSAIKFGNVDWPTDPDDQCKQQIRAPDVQAVASSWAFFKGVSVVDICKADCWKIPTTFSSCYLKDVLQGDCSLGLVALQMAL